MQKTNKNLTEKRKKKGGGGGEDGRRGRIFYVILNLYLGMQIYDILA